MLDDDDLRSEMAHTRGVITISQGNDTALQLCIINCGYMS